jgi:hypothetical protein
MDEQELRDSLRRSAPVLPLVFFNGDPIDGRKRSAICEELGIAIQEKWFSTLQEACSHLWAVEHQRRAVELAGTKNVHELAELCGARPAAIARVMRELRPKPKFLHKAPRQLQGQKNVLVQLWMEPQLKFLATRAGKLEGYTLSAFAREAIYDRVQLVDARAPAPGTHTNCAPRWVKPREKRNRAR